ncbi:MAG TPA: hypothetical protein PLV06_01340 [Bacteroidales bacterium]|nr:hypothetical protein [Bacteroidales bacterium]HPF02883.1 hypothetical protein [Bacteroidales bacterium]HPJ58847.1 hypothetical protein [Bacteroidales bacterium]HPR11003.1 hypothetical protein [Bacteroidales bacterium]HRW84470.1 hypothetical protein [Bacteroidales bacterium]
MIKTLSLAICLVLHPVHVTMTSIDYVNGTDSLKVFVRMYYDDFLLDYQLFDSNNDTVMKYSPDRLLPGDMLNNYINRKVTIIVNNNELEGELLKSKLTDNELSLNFLYRTRKRPEIIKVRNLIMTGLYNDQSNMLIVRSGDFEEGVKLTTGVTEQTFIISSKQ